MVDTESGIDSQDTKKSGNKREEHDNDGFNCDKGYDER